MYALDEELIKSQVLCTPETQVVIHGEDCSVYKIENETGEGVITRYPVFPGIEILYNDIHMTNGVSHNEAPRSNVVEINHCRVGRFECEFSRGGSIYLGEGDLAVNVMTNITNQTWFPLSHYHGITIAVDIPVAESILKQLSEVMGKGLDFDLSAIRDRLCAKNSCFIMRATDSIQHIFSELYRVPQDLKDGYFKIKVIELFLFLNSPEIVNKREERQYFSRKQIDKIKEIRQYLIDNVTQHIIVLCDRRVNGSHRAGIQGTGQTANVVLVGVRGDHVVDVLYSQRLGQIGIDEAAVAVVAAVDHHDVIAALEDCGICLADVQEINGEVVLRYRKAGRQGD